MAKIKVDLFDASLRLGGNLLHEVPRAKITQKEITLLRAMHGEDSVVNIKRIGEVEVDDREELLLLARKYSNTSDEMSGKRLVEKVLSLPLPEFADWLAEQHEYEEMEIRERMLNSQKHVSQDMLQARAKRARELADAAEAEAAGAGARQAA